MLEEIDTLVTWIHFQYEFRAGTTGPAGTYSFVPATTARMTTGVMTKTPNVRAPVRASTISQVMVAAAQITETNSYMLASGNRPTASPRATIDSTFAAAPTTVTTTAARPNRTPQGASGARSTRPIAPGSIGPVRTSVVVPAATSRPTGTASAGLTARLDASSMA